MPQLSHVPLSSALKIDLIPGSLAVTVYEHGIKHGARLIPCWSYVSSGLSSLGQGEVVFTLRRAGAESFPEEPLTLIRSLWDFALEGKTVTHGGRTEFGERGFMAGSFKGIVYVHARPLSGVEAVADLCAILVTEPELRLSERFGMQRLLALLGLEERFFPHPPWIDLQRPTTVTESMLDTMEDGLLSQIPQLLIPHASAINTETQLICTLPCSAAEQFRELFANDTLSPPFAIRLELDPSADSCLVWQYPGAERPAAIARDGSPAARLSGAFLALTADQEGNDYHSLEDGFVLTLVSPVWAALKKALASAEDISIPTTSGNEFRLQFFSDDKAINRAARLLAVDLLSGEEEIAARAGTDALGNYIKRIDSSIQDFFARQALLQPHKLSLSVTLSASAPPGFRLSSQPPLAASVSERLGAWLAGKESLPLSEGQLSFALTYSLEPKRL